MKRLLIVTVAVVLLLAVSLPVGAAANLNFSKSNINRYWMTYPTDLLSPAHVKAMLADLDQLGPTDEARLKQWLLKNFRRFGVAAERVKKIVVVPATREHPQIVILLTNPADEAEAIATSVKRGKDLLINDIE
jgi:hypothetical protein